jgi:hypothetical protein
MAEAAINDYIDPLLRAAKSFYIFETNEYIRGELLKTIQIYDPSFLAEEERIQIFHDLIQENE